MLTIFFSLAFSLVFFMAGLALFGPIGARRTKKRKAWAVGGERWIGVGWGAGQAFVEGQWEWAEMEGVGGEGRGKKAGAF